jgi:integrase
MRTYDALLAFTPGDSAPDCFDAEIGRPQPDFIVSRNVEGDVLSRYGDISWDHSPYSSRRLTHLNFQAWADGKITPLRNMIIEEIRWIMFLIIWKHPAQRASSTKTLMRGLSALRNLARRADVKSISIAEAVSDSAFMFDTPDAQSAEIFKILGILHFLGAEHTGFEITPDILPYLSDAAVTYSQSLKQTAPIPTRIYSEILTVLSAETEKLRQVIDKVSNMYGEIKSRLGVGMTLSSQERMGTNEPTFETLIEKFDLYEFWLGAGLYAGIGIIGYFNFLRQAQTLIAIQIQAYTGMRAEEVQFLPFDCLEESKRDRDSRIHYVINGTTTKLNAGKEKGAQWVTIDAVAEAIRIAQQMAKAIYAANGIGPTQLDSRKKNLYLFPNPNSNKKKSGKAMPSANRLNERIRILLSPTITEEDQQELYAIDPHRAWSTEDKYAVGARWSFRTHQLRRSLALYAQSSGLVSLPTLKRQLQHITVEMSLYYAKGSAFAQNFIGEKQKHEVSHFGEEWRDAQPVSQFLAYASSILLTDKSGIFGGHAQWLKAQKRDETEHVLLNRTETLRRFQKGEMAYRPTPLGGCVNIEPCDKTPINVLSIQCISTDCKNLIASTKKVERIIFVKTNTIRKLMEADPLSAEVRIEQAELSALQSSLARANKLN